MPLLNGLLLLLLIGLLWWVIRRWLPMNEPVGAIPFAIILILAFIVGFDSIGLTHIGIPRIIL